MRARYSPSFLVIGRVCQKCADPAAMRSNNQLKNKAAFELKIAEDDIIFSLINTAATTNNQNTSVSSNTTRAGLAAGFQAVEAGRLAVGNILMHPRGFQGIRGSWTNTDLDQVNMQGLLETGWFASIWNAKIYVTDRLNQLASGFTTALGAAGAAATGTNMIYILALPAQLGRMPIRYDVEIKPWNESSSGFKIGPYAGNPSLN